MKEPENNIVRHWFERSIDCAVTLICWAWFLFGFIVFFSWRYIYAALFSSDPERRFQRYNSDFYRIFFKILAITAPRHTIAIDDEVRSIASGVIVCNHLSYLDPLVLIAIYPRQKTIVKSRFFEMPIFGRIIAKAGYLPDSGAGKFSTMMVKQMDTMSEYLQAGGNLFVFPEGTRSRDGRFGELNTGALKIARLYQAPIYVLQIKNTDKLFTPGKFLFQSRRTNTISLQLLERIEPDYTNTPPTTAELERRVREAFSGGQS